MINRANFSDFLSSCQKTIPQTQKPQGSSNSVLLEGNLKCDTFQKSSPIETANVCKTENTAQTENTWTRDRLEKICDEVWDSVVKNVPIIDELNIEKPKFIFEKNPDSNNVQAAYNFLDNSITCNTNNLEDYYLHAVRNEQGKIKLLVDVLNDGASKEFFENDKKDFPNVERIKLTDAEKDLYLRTVFAHELRHCIQEHLMASTEGCSEIHNTKFKEITDDIDLSGVDLSKLDPELRDELDFSYSVNYRPKKLLDKDTKLKFSMLESDNRFLSVKDHLLKDRVDDVQNKGYASSPLEMDANNFAYEHLLRYSLSFPKHEIPNVRPEVFLGMVSQSLNDVEYALETMEEYGFKPLDQKT